MNTQKEALQFLLDSVTLIFYPRGPIYIGNQPGKQHFPIKIWDKSVQGFLNYDRTYKQENDYEWIMNA